MKMTNRTTRCAMVWAGVNGIAKKKKGKEKVMTDEDLAFKKKQKEEQKKLKEAQAALKGGKKGKK